MNLANSGQLLLFLKFFLIGIIPALLLASINFFSLFIKAKKVYFLIFDIIFCLFFTCIFLYAVNLLNYGEIRLYMFIAFSLGCIVERKTIGKLFAKLHILIYNAINKGVAKFKKSKLFKFLSK